MTSYVQFNGAFADVENKYPSVQLWADGAGNVFFEENGEKQYLEYGDYVVLQGNKHVVTKQKPEDDKPVEKKETPTEKTSAPTKTTNKNDEETEVRPGTGSATTDDRV